MNKNTIYDVRGSMNALLILLICLIVAQSNGLLGSVDSRPNVLYIMSDDHAAHAIGAYGGRLAELNPTPNLDKLASEGILFENCFATNSICGPSRASIITGQYPHTNGAFDLRGSIEAKRQYLAIEMKKAGYETAVIGKWHLKEVPGAFDYYSVLPGQGNYHDPVMYSNKEGKMQNLRFSPVVSRDVLATEYKGHSSDVITDVSLKWLEGRDKSKPFFLMHHFKAPHDLFDHAKRYYDYLADTDIPEPENLWSQPEFGSLATLGKGGELRKYIGSSTGPRSPLLSAHARLTKKFPDDFPENYPEGLSEDEMKRVCYQIYLKKYLRCVKGVDDNIARLMAYLEESGQMENTIIVYSADQGMMLGEHDYQDKRWIYEESMRMPLIVRYPKGMKSGVRTDAIIQNVDFAPTLLDFAGVKTPDYMEGESFKSICETGQEPESWRQAAYYRYWMHMEHHYNPGHLGIRTKDYKLIYYYGCDYEGGNRTPPAWELYHLKSDPSESKNLYDNPEYGTVVTKMKKALARLRETVGDTGEHWPATESIIQEFWDYDDVARAKAEEISTVTLTNYEKIISEKKSKKKKKK